MRSRDAQGRAGGAVAAAMRVLLLLLLATVAIAPATAAKKQDEKQPERPTPDASQPTFFATSFGQSPTGNMVVQYWSKGPLFRSETVIAGHRITTIVNGDTYYIVDPLSGIGVAIRRTKEAIKEDAERPRPFAMEFDELVASGGEKLRTEEMSGGDVDVYRLTDGRGKRTLWVTQDERRLPLRIENYDRATGHTVRIDYVQWLPNLLISSQFFEPAPNITLTHYDSYENYMIELQKGPIPPAPPLFNYLLRRID